MIHNEIQIIFVIVRPWRRLEKYRPIDTEYYGQIYETFRGSNARLIPKIDED